MSEFEGFEADDPPSDTPDSEPDAEGKTIELNLSDGVTAESSMGLQPPLRSEPLDLPPPEPFRDDEEETPPDPPLPPEVLKIWGVSEQSLALATDLIKAWGLSRFLNSELHTQAVKEAEADARMAPIRKAFVEAQRKKEKTK